MLINFTTIKKKYNMNISGIIHIGGHYGQEIEEYVSNGVQKIIVFEPLSKNFEVFCKNIKNVNANIIGHQIALGSNNGTVMMNLSSNDAQSSSILSPKEHLTLHPNVTFNGTEEVKIKTLDSFKYKNYNFINMDVQGYELEVLKGSKKTLDKVDYVYCEVNRGEVYENNAMIEDIDDFLSNYDFIRVETDWSGKLWGDALYIRKNKCQ
jgi:FkbM family methyltransferase